AHQPGPAGLATSPKVRQIENVQRHRLELARSRSSRIELPFRHPPISSSTAQLTVASSRPAYFSEADQGPFPPTSFDSFSAKIQHNPRGIASPRRSIFPL